MAVKTASMKDEIVALERSYWEAIKSKDGERTAELSGDNTLVTGAKGVMSIDKSKMAKMTVEGNWTLESYALLDIKVSTPSPDVAIIAYTVQQKVTMDGKPQDMKAADSSVWIRSPKGWQCHAHTEAFLTER